MCIDRRDRFGVLGGKAGEGILNETGILESGGVKAVKVQFDRAGWAKLSASGGVAFRLLLWSRFPIPALFQLSWRLSPVFRVVAMPLNAHRLMFEGG